VGGPAATAEFGLITNDVKALAAVAADENKTRRESPLLFDSDVADKDVFIVLPLRLVDGEKAQTELLGTSNPRISAAMECFMIDDVMIGH